MEQFNMQVWRKDHPVAAGILGLLLIGTTFSILISALTAPSQPSSKNTTILQATSTQVMVFDMPSLVGKNIDQIRSVLGSPVDKDVEPTKLQLKMMGKDSTWYNSFEKTGVKLLITYDARTRAIVDFFIPDLGDQDKARIMAVGNLKNNDPAYRIEFVRSLKNPSEYTGVRITPTP